MAQEFNLNNNNEWALILGGSSGLGWASAKKLASHGLNLCIVHRTRRSKLADFNEGLEKFREDGIQAVDYNIDALKAENIQQVLDFLNEQNAKVRLLLHSIAKGNLKPLVASEETKNLSTTDFTLTIEAMATSLYTWADAVIKADLFSPQGRIIAFTSEGSSKPAPIYAAVSAAKATLEALMRSMAFEYAPLGLTANCIQAGVTDTESLQMIPGSDKLKEQALMRNPFKRLTTPEDVANAVYLLTKDEAKWINGTVLKVDGGEHLR